MKRGSGSLMPKKAKQMNSHILYKKILWDYLRNIFKPEGEGFLLIGKLFLMVALTLNQSTGNAQSPQNADGYSKRSYNYSLYDAVKVTPFVNQKQIERNPKADFIKFPMARYQIDTALVKKIAVGQLLAAEWLDLPLWVVNDEYGRDTLSLRQVSDKEWIILDIWSETCPPCITSMQHWEKRYIDHPDRFTLLGIYPSFYPHQAPYQARKKGFVSTQIIGASAALLMKAFLGEFNTLGPSVWIRSGRLFGISNANKLKEEDYLLLLSGKMNQIREYAQFNFNDKLN
jgi:hypothetical protein